jgi:hypothetical protein
MIESGHGAVCDSLLSHYVTRATADDFELRIPHYGVRMGQVYRRELIREWTDTPLSPEQDSIPWAFPLCPLPHTTPRTRHPLQEYTKKQTERIFFASIGINHPDATPYRNSST